MLTSTILEYWQLQCVTTFYGGWNHFGLVCPALSNIRCTEKSFALLCVGDALLILESFLQGGMGVTFPVIAVNILSFLPYIFITLNWGNNLQNFGMLTEIDPNLMHCADLMFLLNYFQHADQVEKCFIKVET